MKGIYEYKMAEKNDMCVNCTFSAVCLGTDESCAALRELTNLIEKITIKDKRIVIRTLKRKLEFEYAEPSNWMKNMGERVIKKFEHLEFIHDLEINIGYVLSNEQKLEKGRTVLGKTEKIKKEFKAYLPFDFLITFYEPNIETLDENQIRILMLHELQHIEMGDKGLKIREHDIQDFNNILHQFGINWESSDDVQPDIFDKNFELRGGYSDD